MKEYFKDYFVQHKSEMTAYFSKYYNVHSNEMKGGYFQLHQPERLEAFKAYYDENKDEMSQYFREYYETHKNQKRASSKNYYEKNTAKISAARKLYYANQKDDMMAANRARKMKHAKDVLRSARKYHLKKRERRCNEMRQRYQLAAPKLFTQDMYIQDLNKKLLCDGSALEPLVAAFKDQHSSVAEEMTASTLKRPVLSIAAKRVVARVLQLRNQYAGALLRDVRSINALDIACKDNFGEGLHSVHTEPYFYESAYCFEKRSDVLVVDEVGVCRDNNETKDDTPKHWKCSEKCKPLTDAEVSSVLSFKSDFKKSVVDVRKALNACNACPNEQYCKLVQVSDENAENAPVSVLRLGNSLVCYAADSDCTSSLRILRCASTHFPVLHSFKRLVYAALSSDKHVADIDAALSAGDFEKLFELSMYKESDALFSNNVQLTHKQADEKVAESVLRKPGLELDLQVKHARMISLFEKAVRDYAIHPCCSCNVLFKRSAVTRVNFSDELGKVWPALKLYILQDDPESAEKTLFMCHLCKQNLKKNNIAPRCVLNGLEVVKMPPELAKLDSLGRQFVQRAKAFQMVVRLGTYTNKVPAYNSLKACKGNIFFLPLPLEKTMATLNEVEQALADPELYIIVNSHPTKNRVLWRSMVDVNDIKDAIAKLREINWLYQHVDDKSIDSAVKNVIEVVSKTSSTMLEKVSDEDVSDFQYYTIGNLDSRLNTATDIDQYKLQNLTEKPLADRQSHLDVMCFPVLFPDGKFGEFHPREVKLSPAEYVKSRLWNKDSRFRKDASYIFYLLAQKEKREIKAGMYNMLSSSKDRPTSVSNFFQNVRVNNDRLEANLSTLMQSVRGTKQFWNFKRSELNCMLREIGTPTLFLTFSCAEYRSADIAEYLKLVNEVPDDYNIGKLCTEDPVSVSRQFSYKFHALFNEVIRKGEVFGRVEHFFWKKEYQHRGAPHYHALVWIAGVPVLGKDDPEKVLAWMQERMSCHIPNKDTDPELHRLVTTYQLHKCTDYCKRKFKKGNIYVTRCKFGFPRPSSETAQLHCIEG